MRLEFGEYLNRVLVKARKKYRFTGVVVGRLCFGIIWPTAKKGGDEIDVCQPELPGIKEEDDI